MSAPQSLPSRREPRDQVRVPAILLIVTAGLAFLFELLFLLLGGLALAGPLPQEEKHKSQMENPAYFAGYHGARMGTPVCSCLGLLASPVILFGGIQLLNLQNARLVWFSALLSLLPCSCCFPLGWVAGIWTLVALTHPDVKAAFR